MSLENLIGISLESIKADGTAVRRAFDDCFQSEKVAAAVRDQHGARTHD